MDRHASRRRLKITLALVLAYMVAEVIGGLLTHSLALLADAGHMLSDAASLGVALFAIRMAGRPATRSRTFGYHRAEILAALTNGATLVAVAFYILIEAWQRFRDPGVVDGRTMLFVALGGLAVNLTGMRILGGAKEESLNVRGAWLHVVADTLGSVQVVVAAALIWAFEWHWVDPAASVLIAILITWSAWALLRDASNVLMEAAPGHVDPERVRATILAVDGVRDVHDLHLWTITSGFDALSVHAVVADGSDRDRVLLRVRDAVRERFGIGHATVQLESAEVGRHCGDLSGEEPGIYEPRGSSPAGEIR